MDFGKKPLGTETRSEPVQPVVAEPVSPTPAIVPAEKPYPRKRSAVWRVLLTLLLLVTVGLLIAGWFYVQSLYADLDKKDNELANAKTAAVVKDTDETATSTAEDFTAFQEEYNKFVDAKVTLTTADETAIETAVKDYYKLTTLPEGWQIVVAYKDAKANKETGKPINALVYWPATSTKSAGFFEMTQANDGKWSYNVMRN